MGKSAVRNERPRKGRSRRSSTAVIMETYQTRRGPQIYVVTGDDKARQFIEATKKSHGQLKFREINTAPEGVTLWEAS